MIVRLELTVCSGITLKCVNDLFKKFKDLVWWALIFIYGCSNMSRYRILGLAVIKSQLTLSKLCNLQVDTGKLMTLSRWNLSIKPYL
ncbi:hypothetical protein RDI58_009225 [Solanum bulbocastanum]|uniref:Uncharacterized protein n=1 Tax=Solanum bulbocastanum TaxID=147425 RepID=A0AAN8TXC8_SOLBU